MLTRSNSLKELGQGLWRIIENQSSFGARRDGWLDDEDVFSDMEWQLLKKWFDLVRHELFPFVDQTNA